MIRKEEIEILRKELKEKEKNGTLNVNFSLSSSFVEDIVKFYDNMTGEKVDKESEVEKNPIVIEKNKEVIECIKNNRYIITNDVIYEITKFRDVQQQEVKNRLEKIKNGVFFGLPGDDYDTYYPLELISVIDEETGLCEFFESSIEKTHILSVLDVLIDDMDF